MPTPTARRLADLLVNPHESLDIELKGWLDIVANNDHKAILAKALIALANHGGGFLIFGFTETEHGVEHALDRPATLASYTPDTVNAVVSGYAEPAFHCDVSIAAAPDGLQYPIVSIPGGHRVPIKARRDGSNGGIVRQNSYYIRRPGPQSEIPQNGGEWDSLIRRCVSNARDELLNQMRGILQGAAVIEPAEDDLTATTRWFEESLDRWSRVVGELPINNGAKFPLGHYAFGYRLTGNLNRMVGNGLLEALRRAQVPHTGWPEFWVPTRDGIQPYIYDDHVECWIARDGGDHGPGHSDFWRVSPDGKLFLIRGYQEDEPHAGRPEPGSAFDLTIPTWRVGEALLHSANMAREFGDPEAQVTIFSEWTGLSGRHLTHLENRRVLFDHHRAQQDIFRTGLTIQADQINDSLPELVSRLVSPLYELFDFFQLPENLPTEELARMRANRF